jgi:hypothetical protein
MRELASEPTDRDRRVYEAALVQRRDPEEVGREFGLAAATVLNIARRTHKRLAESAHELLGMSPMEVLILRHDRLQWQSRELDRAWQMSAADRQVTDKIVTTIRKSDGSEQTVQRDVTRMLHSKGPDPRYQRLRDQLDDKLHGVIQEIKELQAKAAEEIARKLRIDEQAQRRAAEAADPNLIKAQQAHDKAAEDEWIRGGGVVERKPKRNMSRKEKHLHKQAKEMAKYLRTANQPLDSQQAVSTSPQSQVANVVPALHVGAIPRAT